MQSRQRQSIQKTSWPPDRVNLRCERGPWNEHLLSFGLRLERLDVRDDIANGVFIGKGPRHGAHQPPLAILGIHAANAAS